MESISLRKNFFWSIINQLSGQVIGLIVSIIFARLLLPTEIGLVALSYLFFTVGERLSDAGLGQSLIRQSKTTSEDYDTVFFTNLFFSIFFYFLLFILAPFVANFYKQAHLSNIIRINGLSLILLAMGATHNTVLNKTFQFKKLAYVNLISSILGASIGIFCAFIGMGFWSLVIHSLSLIIIRDIILWSVSNWIPKFTFSKHKFFYHLNFGYKVIFANIIDAFAVNLYIIIIGKKFSTTEVGLYSRSDSTKNVLVSGVFNAFLRVFYPYFSKMQENSDIEESVKKGILILFYLTTPILLFALILAEPSFRLLFSEKWLPAVPYFKLLCLAALLYALEMYNSDILKVRNRSDLMLKTEIIKKIIIVTFIFMIIPFSSIIFLLYAQILLSVVNFSINAYYTSKVLSIKVKEQVKEIIPILLCGLLSAGLLFYVDSIVSPFSDIARISIGGVSGVLIYILLSRLFKIRALTILFELIKKTNEAVPSG